MHVAVAEDQVWFLASTAAGLQLPVTKAPGDLSSSSGLDVYMHIYVNSLPPHIGIIKT